MQHAGSLLDVVLGARGDRGVLEAVGMCGGVAAAAAAAALLCACRGERKQTPLDVTPQLAKRATH